MARMFFILLVGLYFYHGTLGLVYDQIESAESPYPATKQSNQNLTTEERIWFLERSLENLQSSLFNLTAEFRKGKQVYQNKPVVFYAVLPQTTVLNKNSIIQFSDVLINEGDHFNAYDGIFVAPVSGLYQFSWTTCTMTGKQVFSELRVESNIVSDLHISFSTAGAIPATRVIVCRINEGDHVWVQTGSMYGENYFYAPNNKPQSSFMGLLMKEL